MFLKGAVSKLKSSYLVESKAPALREKLDSSQLSAEAAGSHVPCVENLTAYVKAKLRCFTSTSPLEEVPKALLGVTAVAASESLSYLPCSSSHSGISPWEALSTRQDQHLIDTFKLHLDSLPG